MYGRGVGLMPLGSDDHAQAAANFFSLTASCQLHGLDPEGCLRDVCACCLIGRKRGTSGWHPSARCHAVLSVNRSMLYEEPEEVGAVPVAAPRYLRRGLDV